MESRCFMRKISKKWKIFISIVVILIGSFYGYYKINNRNAFEEMYNSYYNILPIRTIDNMPQIESIPKDEREKDIVALKYKKNNNENNVTVTLVKKDDKKTITIQYDVNISEGVNVYVNYIYDMNSHKLSNSVSVYGDKVPNNEDRIKKMKGFIEQYNISKEQLQKISDEGLDKVLTDWKRYSGSSYSKDNMGRLTIEKDEFLS